MPTEYGEFANVLSALGILVVAATFVERALAFVFEHKWFVKLFMHEEPDPTDNTKICLTSKIPGLKGIIALALSMFICFVYKFDVLSVLFNNDQNAEVGMVLTAFILAGGSAGAIAIFQGYLNISKDSRDAIIAARKAQAESVKQVAEFAAKEAEAKFEKAKAEQKEAEFRKSLIQPDSVTN